MIHYSLFIALGMGHLCYSQKIATDYKEIRADHVPIVCGFRDSIMLIEIRNDLEQLDTSHIVKNLTIYYNDLASVYYELTIHPIDTAIGFWMSENDSLLLRKGIACYGKTLYHNPKDVQALWNIMFSYYLLGDCDRTRHYMMLYKQYEKKKYWDPTQIGPIEKMCQ